ncbi:MAG: pyrimidine reductase [Bacillota bacterium]
MSELITLDFPVDKIQLNRIYDNFQKLSQLKESSPEGIVLPKVQAVYGDMYLPDAPDHRPYTYGCLVFSMEGKIGFPDDPQGPLVARQNFLDEDGALADFWVLNMCRAYADGVIIGAKTLQAEKDVTCHVFDKDLVNQRMAILKKESMAPVNIVVSFDGTDIPLNHHIFNVNELDVWIGTSPRGAEYLQEHFNRNHVVFGPYNSTDNLPLEQISKYLRENCGIIPVLATGVDDRPNTSIFLWMLRALKIKRLLVESPSYIWHLLHEKCLDEAFLKKFSKFCRKFKSNIERIKYKKFSIIKLI